MSTPLRSSEQGECWQWWFARRSRVRPRQGEIWYALVPFEDGSGSKDRPVLVLSVDGRSCTVARFTSQDRSARRDYPRTLPAGDPWAQVREPAARSSRTRGATSVA